MNQFAPLEESKHAEVKDNEILKSAEAARDEGDFAGAADLYAQYLKKTPGNFEVLLKFGNCCRKARRLEEAEAAYRNAIALQPDNYDIHLNYGRLLRQIGRTDEAITSFQKSYALAPRHRAARAELDALGHRPERNVFFLDIFDLITYLRAHRTVTGIQRVVSAILLAEPSPSDSSLGIEYCTLNASTGKLLVFDPNNLIKIVQYALSGATDRTTLDPMLNDVVDTAREATPSAGDVYVIMGAFWIVQDYGAMLIKLRNQGVITATYIYDLIPITHPQYVLNSTRAEVAERFIDVLVVCDFFLTISEFVAKELRELLKNELNTEKPVRAVPLAHALPKVARGLVRATGPKAKNAPEKYVLCVCTLEGRKNHLLLFDVWSRLIRKHGSVRVPGLVLVGKWGWKIEEFQSVCEKENFLDQLILIRTNVSDEELTGLYDNALFTVFPSFVEGWGLPVGESLAFGRPCAASNASSIPEVGGEFAEYFDPNDKFGAFTKIERMIFDDGHRKALEERIHREFKPRTWNEVADNLLRTIEEIRENLVSRPELHTEPLVAPTEAELHELTAKAIAAPSGVSWIKKALRLIRGPGWHPLEEWGCWSRASRPTLFMSLGKEAASQPFTIYLQLRSRPGAGERSFRIVDSHESAIHYTGLKESPIWVKGAAMSDERGVIEITVDGGDEARWPDPPRNGDGRKLYFGLSGFGYHRAGDVEARLNIIESMLRLNRTIL